MDTKTEQTGSYDKYTVHYADGRPVTGRCFLLDPETDPAARVALKAYARATTDEKLKFDIAVWLGWLRLNESEAEETKV